MADEPRDPPTIDEHGRDRTTAAFEPVTGVSMSTLPERVGRWILGQLIDGGGMGRVFKAVHEETRAEAAIKIMRTDLAGDDAVERFRQEGRLLAKMKHPNIAQVYDAGTTRVGGVDTPYIAMEYIPGAVTIREHAATLDTDELLRVFIKICRAVDHANERGIIHRDLKPSNILVDAYGEPKVIDFGVAKNLDQLFDESAVVTMDGGVPGTIPYMAPEQVSWRNELIDRRTDVYALGVVLYELICGRLPYRVNGVPLPEAVRVICDEEPTEPTRMTTREVLGRDLRTVLMKMLAKSRQRRYESAEAVARELERVLAGRDIEASPASFVYKTRRWLGKVGEREPLPTAATIWVLAVALTVLVGPRIVYRELGLAGAYAGFLLSTASVPGEGFENVLVIGLDSFEDSEEALALVDLPPLSEDEQPATRVRPFIGAMLERLALCEPRTVAVDFVFSSSSRAEYIVTGARALRDRGVDTVVGSLSFVPRGYGTDASLGFGDFDESIARQTRWGAISVSKSGDAFAVRLAMQSAQTGEVFPSFALETLAAATRADETAVPQIREGNIRLSFMDRNNADSFVRRRGDGLDVKYTEIGPHEGSDLRFGITKGDVVVNAAVTLPPWAFDESEPSTLRLDKALTMPLAELRKLVAGRVVMIIDLRPGRDQEVLSDGRTLHRGYLWASWLDQELDGRSIGWPGRAGEYQQVVLGGLIGSLLLFVPVGRRRRATAVVVVLLSAGALLAGVVGFQISSVVFVPLLGILALWVAAGAVMFMPRPIEL